MKTTISESVRGESCVRRVPCVCAESPVRRESCAQRVSCAGSPVRRESCAQRVPSAESPVRGGVPSAESPVCRESRLLNMASYGFTQLHTASHSFTQLHTALHSFTQLHTASHGFTRLHTASHGFTGLHRASQGFTGLQGLRGLHRASGASQGFSGLLAHSFSQLRTASYQVIHLIPLSQLCVPLCSFTTLWWSIKACTQNVSLFIPVCHTHNSSAVKHSQLDFHV